MTFMTSKYVLDSHAWIEYFRGTKSGEKVKSFLENHKCFTPMIVLAELSDKYTKEKHDFFEKDLEFIFSNSVILELSKEIAVNAGKIKNIVKQKYKNNFGLADAIILASARKIKAKTVTGDHHFKSLKNIEFLE